MAYEILLKRSAEKELDALDPPLRERILQKILRLEEQPRPRGIRKLSGRQGYRLRVGKYRILYEVYDEEEVVRIMAVGHRRDVYR